MFLYDFKIDFTKSVPYRFCPDTQEAAALYLQCIANAPMDIEFRKIRPGLFNVAVTNEKDKKRLTNKSLSYDFGTKSHELHTATIPLIPVPKKKFFKNPKWITIDKLFDTALRYSTNEQLDMVLEKYGDIIVNTHYETDKLGFRTGRRKARVDIRDDIERWQEVKLEVEVEGEKLDATGRVNFFYKGQPYFCRNCSEQHQDKCPQVITRQLAEKEGETERIEKTKTLLIGDSNLRRVNEKAFYTKTECATGAKIGHIANCLSFAEKDEHEVVIVHAGQNNVLQEDDVNNNDWKQQTLTEVNSLKNSLSKFKKAIVVGVPPAPWCKKTAKTIKMRTAINDALKNITRDNLHIQYVDIEQEDEDDESNWEDQRHMTEKFTTYVMGKISEKMENTTGQQFHIPNTPWTTERKYGKVKTTYKLGCSTCTKLGHSEEICPGINKTNALPTTTNGKKRDKCSGSDEPKPKK
jgi:hypothetical protein